MKIIRKAKILPCECKRCHTIFQPRKRNLKRHAHVFCPLCGYGNDVEFSNGDYLLELLATYIGIGNAKNERSNENAD